MAGYPSFSTAAFFGLGAYVGAIAQRQGLSLALAWLLAACGVALFGGLLGTILLRLRGHYFAIGSIAIVEICRLTVSSWSSLTGGGDGLNLPLMRWSPAQVSSFFLEAMLFILLLSGIATFVVSNSRFGFGLRCIKQNEDAASLVGVDATLYKVAAYVLSAGFSALVGAAYASWTGYIDPTESFQIVLTLKVPVMVMLGGIGTFLGPAVGAAMFLLLEETVWSHFLDWNRAILGAVIVIVIFFVPGGILNVMARRVLISKSPANAVRSAA
jgi:branched-chain amino acid transport system permease protein